MNSFIHSQYIKRNERILIMNWLKYELHTNTHDAPIIGNILCSMGIDGYEIKDHVPLTEKEEKQMYTDIPADMGADDGSSILTFYTEVPGEEIRNFSAPVLLLGTRIFLTVKKKY